MTRGQAVSLILILSLGFAGCGSGTGSLPLQGPPAQGPSGSGGLSITPTSAPAGSPDVKLLILGAGFSTGHLRSTAIWSVSGARTSLATTFVSKTQLTAIIPSALLLSVGSADVFVQTWDPMGDIPPTNTSPVAFAIVAPNSATFVSTADMVAARKFHTGTLLGDGTVLVAGGLGLSGPLASAEIFDPIAASFHSTGTMTEPRDGHCAILLRDGRVLIAGARTL